MFFSNVKKPDEIVAYWSNVAWLEERYSIRQWNNNKDNYFQCTRSSRKTEISRVQ